MLPKGETECSPKIGECIVRPVVQTNLGGEFENVKDQQHKMLNILKRTKHVTKRRNRMFPKNRRMYCEASSTDKLGRLIHYAAIGKLPEVVKIIETEGLSVNSCDYDKRYPLHLAAAEGKLEIVKYLVEKGADVHAIDRWGNSPMTDAVASGQSDVVEYLRQYGGSFDKSGAASDVCDAAQKNNIPLLEKYIKAGVDINIGDYDKRTALHIAASEGHLEAVKFLIEHGANVNVVDRFGNTPLSDSSRGRSKSKKKIYEILKQAGAVLEDAAWIYRNSREFQNNVNEALPTMVKKGGFEYAEVWIPGDDRENLFPSDEWFVIPEAVSVFDKFHREATEGTQIAKGVGLPGLSYSIGESASLDESKTSNVQRENIMEKFGIESALALPIKYSGETIALIVLYSTKQINLDKTTRKSLIKYASGLVASGLNFSSEQLLFEAKGRRSGIKVQEVFNMIVKEGVFNSKIIFQDVDWFYDLEMSEIYFERFSSEDIAKHIHSLIAAKKLAQARGTPDDIFISMEEEGGAFYVCPGTYHKSLEIEEKIENFVTSLPEDKPYSVTYFCSQKNISSTATFPLSMYIVESSDYVDSKVDPADTNIWTVASTDFLRQKKGAIRQRYQDIVELSVNTIAPVIQRYEVGEDGLVPIVLALRGGKHKPLLRQLTELFKYHNLGCRRKFVETFANGVVVYTFYAENNEEKLNEYISDASLLVVVPSSTLTQLFAEGKITVKEYMYITAAYRCIYYFLNKSNDEIIALKEALKNDATNLGRLDRITQKLSREAVSPSRIKEMLIENMEMITDLYQDFVRCLSGDRSYNQELSDEITLKIHNELDQLILKEFLVFNSKVIKTNFNIKKKAAISFRLESDYIVDNGFPENPFGIFYIIGAYFQGFHIRFRDVARGGIRIIISKDRNTYNKNLEGVFAENYGLAFTQNSKNKDIPEFGSKGTVLLHKGADQARVYAFQTYISAMLDLLVISGESSKGVVDNYKKEEILFLGPDENSADLMEWAALYAKSRGYNYWKAFTTGKPPSLGGIPHDTYGMTTNSVHRYVLGSLQKLGIKEENVRKLQTGGPDGDLGSNEILISKDKTIAIVDGSGVLYEPDGLDREELTRLAVERLTIEHFDKSKLSPAGFLVLVTDVDVLLPTGEHVANGVKFRNNFHLHPLSKCDMFVPCGGRPGSINLGNIKDVISEDGTPKWKILVEGANLFVTQDARLELESKGVILYKDASSNKGGVTSSSLEVLAALAMSDEEHKEHMQVHDEENVPPFYQEYVENIVEIINKNADLEFECIWREHLRTGMPRSVLTDVVSAKINQLNDILQNESSLWENQALRTSILSNAIPNKLLELVSLETLHKRVPNTYLKAIFSAYLSSQFVYKFGINASEFAFFEYVNPLLNR
eukprot:TRINITY_DN5247_c0_g1_i1.p1 TRINITY_DN5247_c0_g1~~TRINITY_DN5247_c0_g1_i1.p1  ORF type:complete len:1393 (-),score=361.44 TRINITY_DN5247_c0_g1_i1:42-4220(-)